MAKQAGAAPATGGKDDDQGTPDMAALKKRIEELEKGNADLKTANAKLTGTVEQFLLGSQDDDDQKKPEKPAKAPDPVADPVGFTAYVEKRAEERVSNVRDELTQQQALERVWQKFKGEHKELSAHEELVEATALRQLKEMGAQGVKDPIKALLNDPDAFLKTLAERVQAKIDAIKGVKRGEDGQPVEEPAADDAPRTDGVIGPGMPVVLFGKPDPKKDKPGDFSAELRAAQAKMGIF